HEAGARIGIEFHGLGLQVFRFLLYQGAPLIVYTQEDPAGLVLARATTPTPSAGSDWEITTLPGGGSFCDLVLSNGKPAVGSGDSSGPVVFRPLSLPPWSAGDWIAMHPGPSMEEPAFVAMTVTNDHLSLFNAPSLDSTHRKHVFVYDAPGTDPQLDTDWVKQEIHFTFPVYHLLSATTLNGRRAFAYSAYDGMSNWLAREDDYTPPDSVWHQRVVLTGAQVDRLAERSLWHDDTHFWLLSSPAYGRQLLVSSSPFPENTNDWLKLSFSTDANSRLSPAMAADPVYRVNGYPIIGASWELVSTTLADRDPVLLVGKTVLPLSSDDWMTIPLWDLHNFSGNATFALEGSTQYLAYTEILGPKVTNSDVAMRLAWAPWTLVIP
ncbi:MAG: hypothetical protein ABI743_13635, partial [bacterium]